MGFGRDMLYTALAVVTCPVWVYRLLRTGKWRTDWAGRLGRGEMLERDGRSTLLIHAVSVGEVNAVRHLVDRLHGQTKDNWRIVISTTTDTGYARAKQLFADHHTVVRYPLDWSWCVRRFLERVCPDLVALTELEVWPNFVDQCHRHAVAVCVINGRLSERSFARYRWIKWFVRSSFARLTVALVQSQAYAQRFRALGTPDQRVVVVDSMKWDAPGSPPGKFSLGNPGNLGNSGQPQTLDSGGGGATSRDREGAGSPPIDESQTSPPHRLAAAMGIDLDKPILVAGSTGPSEERMLIDTCPQDAQLLLVPRKPERFEEVAQLEPGITRRSRHPDGGTPPASPSRVFLIDTMGELLKAYALADVAIVGRSFMGDLYGSNPLEPIAQGKPTLIGPHYGDFADMVDELREEGGIEVTDQPGRIAAELLADPDRARRLAEKGQVVITARRGATDRHVEWITRLMRDPTINL